MLRLHIGANPIIGIDHFVSSTILSLPQQCSLAGENVSCSVRACHPRLNSSFLELRRAKIACCSALLSDNHGAILFRKSLGRCCYRRRGCFKFGIVEVTSRVRWARRARRQYERLESETTLGVHAEANSRRVPGMESLAEWNGIKSESHRLLFGATLVVGIRRQMSF